MDVYQVVNIQSFQDSAAQIDSGSSAACSSGFVTLLATLTVLMTVLTILL